MGSVEQQPGYRQSSSGSARDDSDQYVVVLTEPHGKDDPLQWPARHKWVVTNILSTTGLYYIVVSTIMAPALSEIAAEPNISPTLIALPLSIYLLDSAFGPTIIELLSNV